MFAVSNRQVSEAAGQGNNAAVGYHFGTKTDLVRAIEHKHRGPIEVSRASRWWPTPATPPRLRDWVACLVQPAHRPPGRTGQPDLVRAGSPRRLMTDPAYHNIVVKRRAEFAVAGAGHRRHQPTACPTCPPRSAFERNIMARNLLMHSCADRERGDRPGRQRAAGVLAGQPASGLIDAIVGLWTAPVTRESDLQMKVTVDQDKCVSSGQCVLNASDVFDQRDDDGVVVLLEPEPGPDQTDNARRAAAACPALAIDIQD